MPNPDYPAPIKQKLFVLDYDAYCNLLLSYSDIEQYITQFHDKIKLSFEQVISDALRKRMGLLNGH